MIAKRAAIATIRIIKAIRTLRAPGSSMSAPSLSCRLNDPRRTNLRRATLFWRHRQPTLLISIICGAVVITEFNCLHTSVSGCTKSSYAKAHQGRPCE